MAGIGLRCSGWGGGCRYGGGRGNGQCKASSLGGGKNSTINAEFSGHRPTLSNIIAALAKAGAIPARTITANVEATAAVAEVAVVAKRIATHCDSTGLHQLSLWSARRCTLPLHRQPAHILRTIGRTTTRAAEGAAPTTTAATATTWPGTPAAT